MNHLTGVLSAAFILMAVGTTTQAGKEYFRWIDDRGRPVHSDRPPPKGVDYEVVSVKFPKNTVPTKEDAVPAEVDESGADNGPEGVAAAPQRSKSPELCNRAKSNLESLTSSENVRVRNEYGEVRYLTAEEIALEREKAQAQIDTNCD